MPDSHVHEYNSRGCVCARNWDAPVLGNGKKAGNTEMKSTGSLIMKNEADAMKGKEGSVEAREEGRK